MLKFTKMHGIGNDYVYINCFEETLLGDPAALAVRLADRHFGIGGDGLILICPSERGDARMRMFNADGSESEMCGNGVRCVAKYVYDHGIAKKPELKIETGNGVLLIGVTVEHGVVTKARVDMGEPILEAAAIPTTFPPGKVVNATLPGFEPNIAGLDPRVTCVSVGNPHATFYCDDVAGIPLATIGPKLERDPAFPRRINVHFVQVHSPREVTMRTWERGSGITLACGTGATAVCVSGVLAGKSERKILAHLPGGDLELEWSSVDNRVYMTGSATEVFTGEIG